ncbi:MAG: alkene reductase [Sulfuricella sp.]|jgi:N-ethylmaleimide reductase|nr:alkene reductase [Sulfuricella sp.]
MPNNLFSPIELGSLKLANRIVMAPLTRNRAGAGNAPQAMNVEYYRQRASAGLIITEGAQISATAVGYLATPGIHSAEQIAGWKQVTDAVHSRGGKIFLQLWHCGRVSHPSLQPGGILPVAPSAILPASQTFTPDGWQALVTPRALETSELPGIVADYRQAAQNCVAAGFDGVEIHAANGYLLDQFIRDGSNQRTDAYGGSPENRSRLLLEVTEAVTGVWGAGRVGVRLSPINSFNDMRDSDPQKTFDYMASALNAFDLAYLHGMELDFGTGKKPDFDFARFRRCFKGRYMANGGYDKARADAALASGYADLVAFGALFIANPDLPERFAQNAALNEPDPSTFYGGDEKGYTDYPFLA